MKPSERIRDIVGGMDGGQEQALFNHLVAMTQYLDEEWEKKEKVRKVKSATMDFMDGKISAKEARSLAIKFVIGDDKKDLEKFSQDWNYVHNN